MAISKESSKAGRRPSATACVALSIIFILLSVLPLAAQTITYYIQGLHRQPSAAAARAYLGVGVPGGYGTLASADFVNQGTVTTVLHGNAAGNPYWDTVDLANEVNGNLAVTHLNGGLNADATHYWRGDGTWATIVAPTILDIRTNAYNNWDGTNCFDGDVQVDSHLTVHWDCNVYPWSDPNYSDAIAVFHRVDYVFPDYGAQLLVRANTESQPTGGSVFSGIRLDSRQDMFGHPGNLSQPLELRGGPLFLITGSSSPIYFQIYDTYAGQISTYHDLLMGDGNVEAFSLFSTRPGGIMATNFIHSARAYMRAYNGFVANSNSWEKVPSFVVPGTVDTFNCGDIWIVSSNGWPYVITKTPPGCTLWTNPLTQSEILSTTNFGLIVTNVNLSKVAWRDQITSGLALGAGVSAPTIVNVSPAIEGLTIRGMGFSVGDDGHGTCQFNHDVARTNSSMHAFFVEPHIHIAPVSLASGTNATFRFVYNWANINSIYTNVTGALTNTISFTNMYEHIMLEFGHITNSLADGSISSVMRFAIERLATATGDVGAPDVIVDSVDIHYPVYRFGSSKEDSD